MKTPLFLSAVACLLPRLAVALCVGGSCAALAAQMPSPTPAPTPPPGSYTTAPAYPVPYNPAKEADIQGVLDRMLAYLDTATPLRVVDRATGAPVTDFKSLPANPVFERTDFLLTSYEWGVTYSGMLRAAAVTGDARYRDYVTSRLAAIAAVAVRQREFQASMPAHEDPANQQRIFSLRAMLHPRSLDDSGALCAALIRTAQADPATAPALRPWIDNYMAFISTKQFRLPDGTLARHRPLANALWLDDLYMSVPALSEMGVLTGDRKYFDDAVKQITQFSARMFLPEKGWYRHGWIQEMDPHPSFFWARANGWAVVAMAELLSVLPEDHPGRPAVLAQYRAHVAGLAAAQGGTGLWHQLLDRHDSYLETSASAMFVYSIARGINRGWLDPLAYGPCAYLGWNAVAQQVNAKGQVEGTCVGTGMGFDPTFYYYRPTSVFAAHGYGPVLLAGAEMIELRRGKGSAAQINGGAVQLAPSPSRH
jgi:rhamnogalacturonyl hydrolase YesR